MQAQQQLEKGEEREEVEKTAEKVVSKSSPAEVISEMVVNSLRQYDISQRQHEQKEVLCFNCGSYSKHPNHKMRDCPDLNTWCVNCQTANANHPATRCPTRYGGGNQLDMGGGRKQIIMRGGGNLAGPQQPRGYPRMLQQAGKRHAIQADWVLVH